MPFTRAGQIARSVTVARLTDPLGLVAENLRSSPHGVLPVLDRVTFGEEDPAELKASVLGLIDVRDLARVTRSVMEPAMTEPAATAANVAMPVAVGSYMNGSSAESNGVYLDEPAAIPTTVPIAVPVAVAPPPSFENLTARDVMNSDVPHIPSVFSLENALLTLDRYEYSALPVLDEKGQYRGIVSRADIIAALGKQVRPPMVGGMATPLGVWLTNGTLNGGAPALGLFLSGLALSACYSAAFLAMILILRLINPAWGALAISGRLGLVIDSSGMLNLLAFVGQSLLFLLAMRAIPMAGIHAAEHQTVHAMERGLPLELEYVSKMPRAHPRCGTNLIALVGLVTIGLTHLPKLSPDWILLVLVVTFFSWRSLGTIIQEWFTTRPASKKQLESGIKAGRELIEKYQEHPFAAPPRPFKLLNNGLLLSAVGMMLGTSFFFWLIDYMGNWLIQ